MGTGNCCTGQVKNKFIHYSIPFYGLKSLEAQHLEEIGLKRGICP